MWRRANGDGARMPRQLKVYGWIGWRNECPPAANGNHQTREVVAARSMAEVGRIVGESPRRLDMSETGNQGELTVALSAPGTVFWHPLDERAVDREWRRG